MQAEELSTSRGIPDPSAIAQQREAYSRSLDHQLERGSLSLQEQHRARKQQLYIAAQQRKKTLMLQVDKEMREKELALDDQKHQALLGLRKAMLDQQATLDQQAASLTLEYQQRQLQDEFASTQADMHRHFIESHLELQKEVHMHENPPPCFMPAVATGAPDLHLCTRM